VATRTTLVPRPARPGLDAAADRCPTTSPRRCRA